MCKVELWLPGFNHVCRVHFRSSWWSWNPSWWSRGYGWDQVSLLKSGVVDGMMRLTEVEDAT